LDFTIRHFHYCSLTGDITKPQYRQIVDACRRRHEELVQAAQKGQPVPVATGLPSRLECWSCAHPCLASSRYCASCGAPTDTPEVRQFRYRTFLCQEIRGHEQAGCLTPAQANQLLTLTAASLADLRQRVEADGLRR
jgi:hypothetical protein